MKATRTNRKQQREREEGKGGEGEEEKQAKKLKRGGGGEEEKQSKKGGGEKKTHAITLALPLRNPHLLKRSRPLPHRLPVRMRRRNLPWLPTTLLRTRSTRPTTTRPLLLLLLLYLLRLLLRMLDLWLLLLHRHARSGTALLRRRGTRPPRIVPSVNMRHWPAARSRSWSARRTKVGVTCGRVHPVVVLVGI